ncbi:MAG: hypothetical protein ACM31D_04730 [Bacteroidota bacterium]
MVHIPTLPPRPEKGIEGGFITTNSANGADVVAAFNGGSVIVAADFMPIALRAAGYGAHLLITAGQQAAIAAGLRSADRHDGDLDARMSVMEGEISDAFGRYMTGIVEIIPRRGCPRWLAFRGN